MSLAVTVAALAIGFLASIGGMAAFVRVLRALQQLMRNEIVEWNRIVRDHCQHHDQACPVVAGAEVASPARSVPEAGALVQGPKPIPAAPVDRPRIIPDDETTQAFKRALLDSGMMHMPVNIQCNGTCKSSATVLFGQTPGRTMDLPVSCHSMGLTVPVLQPAENGWYGHRVSLMVGVDDSVFDELQLLMVVVCVTVNRPVNFTVQFFTVESSDRRGWMPHAVILDPCKAVPGSLVGFRDGTDMTSMSEKWYGLDESTLKHLAELNEALREVGARSVSPTRFAALCDIVCGGCPLDTVRESSRNRVEQWNVHELRQLRDVGWLEDRHINNYYAVCRDMGVPVQEAPAAVVQDSELDGDRDDAVDMGVPVQEAPATTAVQDSELDGDRDDAVDMGVPVQEAPATTVVQDSELDGDRDDAASSSASALGFELAGAAVSPPPPSGP